MKELMLEKRRGVLLSEVSGHKLPLETLRETLTSQRSWIETAENQIQNFIP